MVILLLYLFGALFISFTCSILEAVLFSTPLSYITMLEDQGVKGAERLRNYKTNIDRPVAAILSLNTIAHTVGAAGVGQQSTALFGDAYFGLVSGLMTLLILVFSEIIPKKIGASFWRQLVMPVTNAIRVIIIITYPLVLLSELITKWFQPRKKPLSVSREEVSAMVDLGTEEGTFKEQENTTIQHYLDAAQMTAEQIMTPSTVVASAPETMTMREFHANKSFNPFSRIVLYRDNTDFITGYVLRASVLEKLAEDKFGMTLATVRRDIISFQENTPISEIWDKMIQSKEHISIITDEYGCLRGIVTMEDVIETMLGVEIVDENDNTTDMRKYAREKWMRVKSQSMR